ncbi:MAG: tyrosine-type recombinase/integrase [Gammaproteobacteria bacterium]
MARQVRDARLETREARARLKARDEPYWRLIHERLHLGYRKRARGGVWVVRVYKDGKYFKRNLGRADETEEADGETVLSFKQAQRRAIEREHTPKQTLTVADAMRDYLGWYASHRKGLQRTESVVRVHVLPALGSRIVAELTTPDIRKWHESLATADTRLRTGRFSAAVNTREGGARARRATANRVLTVLKAALNHAWRDGSVPLDEAWRRVTPFRGVDAPKVRYLNNEECRRLINACRPEFRPLVQVALLTGCRYGEICAMRAGDYNPDSGTVYVAESKGGKPRHVPLSDEGRDFFAHATVGRLGNDLLFTRTAGMPWGPSHQQRPLQRACVIARVEPAASFHVLRHTYGSALAMRGAPLQVIAAALGHADTRITGRHYTHLLPSYVADTIRANLPSFGIESANITPLRRSN